MTDKPLKRTDQQWLDLIQECRASGLTDKDWCVQNHVSISSFYYHIRSLRKKACEIPAKMEPHEPCETQEVVCLSIQQEPPAAPSLQIYPEQQDAAALFIDLHGIHITISNHAAPDTILSTIRALNGIC